MSEMVFVFKQETAYEMRISDGRSDVSSSDLGYSVGYTGAPASDIKSVEEIWQPLIWQEKRFPDRPYLTLAFRSPLPTALVTNKGNTIGVLAKSSEFPFDPLPMLDNSSFGISVRNNNGESNT